MSFDFLFPSGTFLIHLDFIGLDLAIWPIVYLKFSTADLESKGLSIGWCEL